MKEFIEPVESFQECFLEDKGFRSPESSQGSWLDPPTSCRLGLDVWRDNIMTCLLTASKTFALTACRLHIILGPLRERVCEDA